MTELHFVQWIIENDQRNTTIMYLYYLLNFDCNIGKSIDILMEHDIYDGFTSTSENLLKIRETK